MKRLLFMLLATQVSSCQNKEAQNQPTEKKQTKEMQTTQDIKTVFQWHEGVNAPAGYPVEVYRGGLEDPSTSLAGMGGSANIWGSPSSGMSNGIKGIPKRLNCIWVAYAEDCEYKIDCTIDYDKMLHLFNEGFYSGMRKMGKKRDTYNAITVGFAPGGVVVVWLSGAGKQVEVGRYQGEKTKISQAEINSLDSHERLLFDPIDRKSTMENTGVVPLAIQEANKNKPIPFGLWDSYREKYSWRPKYIIQNDGKMDDDVGLEMFNAEKESLIYEIFDENKFEKRAIPNVISFGWWDKYGLGYGANIDFDEEEIFAGFHSIYKDSKEGDAEIEIKTNMTNTFLTIKLKGNGKEIPILKAKIEVFESRAVTKRYKKE